LKVLIIVTNSDEAGAPRHVETIVNGLRDEFQFISVFGETGPVSDRLQRQGDIVHVIREMRTTINPAKDLVALFKIARLVLKYQPDIIHCHSAKAGMLGRICAFLCRKNWLYTVHGWGWRGVSTFAKKLITSIESVLSKLPRGYYIFVAQDVMTEGLSVLKLSPLRGSVIYNGVSPIDVQLPSTNNPFVVMMPARVSSAKDHESLISAIESINDPSIRLLLCGTGTDTPEFIKLATLLAPNTYESISFMGQRSDMQHIYLRAHVVALISNFEALPLSILEALSCSRAVIATNTGGIPELIETGINGILVRPNCVDDITIALIRCRDEKFRIELGKQAKKAYEERFTDQAMLQSIALIYRSIGQKSK
jgi:glycosyltransferase involved in cell wall biosynthesis